MKRAPFRHDRVPRTMEDAEVYARHSTRHAKRPAGLFAKGLIANGFESGDVLDVGAGSGVLALEVARRIPGARVTGLDLSRPMLDIARRTSSSEGLSGRVKFVQGDVQEMPFEDDSFDAVLSMNTFHMVDDPAAMVNEMERVLRPGGIFILSCIKRSWRGHLMPILKTAYTIEETREIMERTKLQKWKIEEYRLAYVVTVGDLKTR